MNCCQGIARMFNDKYARRDLARFRRKGAHKTTRALVDALAAQGVAGATLLDIGGGVGAIQYALLDAGAARATSVEASPGYAAASLQEADRLGHADRITRVGGDFTYVANDLDDADIVTLDRVICCYDDMLTLVGRSADKTRRLYGAVYPRDRNWIRGLIAIENLAMRVLRNPMRFFMHPTAAVDALLRERGLAPLSQRDMGIWQVVVYGRLVAR